MFKKLILTFIAIFFIGTSNLIAQTGTKLPDTPAGKRAAALLKTIAQADEASIRKFLEENASEEFRNAFPIEQRINNFQTLKRNLPGLEITNISTANPNSIELTIKAQDGGTVLANIQLDPNPPHLIASIGYEVRPPAAQKASFNDKPDLQTPGVVNAENRAMIIESALKQINELYVFPEVAKEMEKAIRERMRKKEYDNITSADEFAKKLTADLQAASRDKHMRVVYSDKLSLGGNPQDYTPAQREEARLNDMRDNYGFVKAEQLPGNIGYLDLRKMYHPPVAGDKATAAMNFLSDTDALIIDLRKAPGGSGGMVSLLMSYLVGPEPVHLNTVYDRNGNRVAESRTLKDVPGKRYTGKNVYVLTSNFTFSAAEALAYAIQTLKRGTIIGETTGGGGNPNTYVRLSEHFQLSVAIARGVNPITKTNWEGVGVKPDVEVPADLALKTAQIMALKQILEKSTNENYKADLKKIIETTQKELDELRKK